MVEPIEVDTTTKMIMLLQRLPNLTKRDVLDIVEQAERIKDFKWTINELKSLNHPRLNPSLTKATLTPLIDAVNCDVEWCQSHHINIVNFLSPYYPVNVANNAKFTTLPLLYVAGDYRRLNAQHLVGIVGTRRPTDDGTDFTARITQDVIKQNYVTISGLATGTDSTVANQSIANGGFTIAVIAGGFKHGILPVKHRKTGDNLANHIIQSGGAIVSAYQLDTPYQDKDANNPWYRMNQRDELIVALSDSIIATEINYDDTKHQINGGTAYTLNQAQRQKRPVLVPNWLALHQNVHEKAGLPNVQQGCLWVIQNQVVTPITNATSLEISLMAGQFEHQQRFLDAKFEDDPKSTGESMIKDIPTAADWAKIPLKFN